MRIELSSPVRKRAFLAGCVAVLFLGLSLCCQEFAEQTLLAAGTPNSISRAARLQPLNAEPEEKLGILYLSPLDGDFRLAANHLEKAVALNPHSSSAWLALANAYFALDDEDRRRDAVSRALISEPKDTEVQWAAANLFLSSDLNRSLELLREVVENDPRYAPTAMEVAYHATDADIDKTMLAVPLTSVSRLQLMRWLLERDHPEAADRVWPTVLEAPGTLAVRDTFFYLDSLIARHQPAEAFTAWSAIRQKDPALRVRRQPDNLLSNGDFEDDLLNGGFGWRYSPVSGVTASLDTSTFHAGTRSLLLQINSEDVQDFGVTQLVAVLPGSHCRVSGWVHAEELEAAHGVRLAILDGYSHVQLALSDDVVGSFPWRELTADFTVPENTGLVQFAVVRSPSNGVIRGRLWLDNVSIEKQ